MPTLLAELPPWEEGSASECPATGREPPLSASSRRHGVPSRLRREGPGDELTLQRLELGPGGLASRLVPEAPQSTADGIPVLTELRVDLALRHGAGDMLPDVLERIHLGIDREPLDRRPQAPSRPRVGQGGQHPPLLAHQRADLLPESHEVRLGLLRLGAHLRDQGEGGLLVASTHRPPDVVVQPRDLGAALPDLPLQLVSHVEDPGDGLLQLPVLAYALGDRLLVDDLGALLLAAADPGAEAPPEEAANPTEHA